MYTQRKRAAAQQAEKGSQDGFETDDAADGPEEASEVTSGADDPEQPSDPSPDTAPQSTAPSATGERVDR